jgi:uncharacterized protein YqkB
LKTNRTYSIDVNVAKDLRQKQNQSQFVEDAIKAKLYPSHSTLALHDAPAVMLLYQLLRIYDKDSHEYKLIENMWTVENKKHITSLGLDVNL